MFKEPPWASNPASKNIYLKITSPSDDNKNYHISDKSYYLFGRDKEHVDYHLNHDSCSRLHAAIVHHKDGRIFLIDHSTKGTTVNGAAIPRFKPHHLTDGSEFKFAEFPSQFKTVISDQNPILDSNPSITHDKRPRTGDERADGDKENDLGQPCSKRPRLDRESEFNKGNPSVAKWRVRACHILIKHKESRRPSSWKEPVVTRTKEEAIDMARNIRRRLQDKEETFSVMAETESDCSSAKRGGDLGSFGPSQMQHAFEAATLALQVGEISEPIDTDSGIHIILRTA
uniref:Peptidyl-prolyl cis-trans isomerase n=1 Tax=Polytomella parva TaxID=51329 RepID=A0A7S0UMW3_9CHLO|mmetsp:Transcript_10399/g.19154  ORF Transcript_10399/g.19154 Transcript_10399/m.19154 type:complete len:286 (+) Transcript_10399:47-904(+)